MVSKLHYISQGHSPAEQLRNIQRALDAGCDWIQLRWKNVPAQEVEQVAIAVRALCEPYRATLIINDFPNVAHAVEAHGVHLGLTDMSVIEARQIVGPDKIIGGTANTLEDILQRVEEQCTYVGLGPFRFTTTKEKLSPILGLEGYHAIMHQLRSRAISIPIIAIGGLQQEDLPALLKTGVHGIAVSGLITQSAEKETLVTNLRALLDEEQIQA
ncbi:thiamine phosphate synthase [Cytophagaceae bacterium YF14B1]|uniref:Thiamine-phosphate synthase n=1 Tax=Xanthocytophaga flava TaxID=3048013 RepID=A0AAE3R0Q1_9BACT|nr:thiamine phosphate synthase [Xanthocytophaga flavus]MDJ1486204.1 thiamine phosphate synthase [Xanthocytophaga flavus]